jgi:hypothetical protein
MNDPAVPAETSPVWRSFRVIAIIGGLAIGAVLVGRTCFDTQGRVLVKARAPTGVEIYVVQRFLGEPYTTSFHCRRPDGVWGWGYIDHEDDFWPAGRAQLQVNEAARQLVVMRDGKPLLHYDWGADEYVLHRFNMRTNRSVELWDPTLPIPAWWKSDLLPPQ